MIEKITRFFEEILEKDPGEIKPDQKFRDFAEWDSLAYISLVTKIDEEFDVTIRQEDFQRLTTLSEIARHIENVRST